MTTPRHPARRRQRSRDDRGYVLPAAIITLTLLAIASALTARVFAELLAASATERLAITHTATARSARAAVDAWMADPAASTLVAGSDPRYVSDVPAGREVWFDDTAAAGCVPAANTACWQITAVTVTDTADLLRGGEALQQRAAVDLRVVAGCVAGDVGSCRLDTRTERVYERAVFAYYQISYNRHTTFDEAFDEIEAALAGPDRRSYPADCDPPEDTRPECVPDPALTPGLAQTLAHALELRNAAVVFTTNDALNGPLRHNGRPSRVLYCGSPTFERVETRGTDPPLKAPGCTDTGAPKWTSGEQLAVRDDTIILPTLGASPTTGCPLTKIAHPSPLPADTNADTARGGGCPGEPGSGSHFIRPDDIITNPHGAITIERLSEVVERRNGVVVRRGSVTVHAAGDIVVCGDITADGANPAGGPNVIALITGGDVVIAPGADNKQCETPDSAPVKTAAVTIRQSVRLANVAILAPDGGVYTRRWYLPCGDVCPTLTIEGSIAADHLGLYGIPDHTTGHVTHGWRKQFTYPPRFWLARPPLWPNLPPGEWTHLR